MIQLNRLTKSPRALVLFQQTSLFHSTLQESSSIQSAVETKSYNQIPHLLISNPNPNPFSFLSTLSESHKTQIIDEILQSLIHLRPRSLPQTTYTHLLTHTLQNLNPFPLALAILQRTLRSGCLPAKPTHLSLSSTWLISRTNNSVSDILSTGMRSIGYRPDSGTCNYLVYSLSAAHQFDEAVLVLKTMTQVGCEPDSDAYGAVIGSMCGVGKVEEAVELVKGNSTLVLREDSVVRLVKAMRVRGEMKGAVEMVRWLERVGVRVGFDGYEVVVRGCLEWKEFVLAGKMVTQMVGRGFIPHIRVRQGVVDGLVGVGKLGFASMIRQKFANQIRS